MNLTAILSVGVLVAGVAGYLGGRVDGTRITEAKHAEKQALVEEARDEMIHAAAAAIADIEIRHQTIRQEVQREIIEKPVYRECVNTPDGLLLINQALTNERERPTKDLLPEADPS